MGLTPVAAFPDWIARIKRWSKGKFALCLNWDIHLLSRDILAPGSGAFKFRLGLTPSAPL